MRKKLNGAAKRAKTAKTLSRFRVVKKGLDTTVVATMSKPDGKLVFDSFRKARREARAHLKKEAFILREKARELKKLKEPHV